MFPVLQFHSRDTCRVVGLWDQLTSCTMTWTNISCSVGMEFRVKSVRWCANFVCKRISFQGWRGTRNHQWSWLLIWKVCIIFFPLVSGQRIPTHLAPSIVLISCQSTWMRHKTTHSLQCLQPFHLWPQTFCAGQCIEVQYCRWCHLTPLRTPWWYIKWCISLIQNSLAQCGATITCSYSLS